MTANPPSLTADLRRGNETQVLLKLQGDGVMPEDYSAIATNDTLRAEIVAAILKYRLFATPEQQIETLLRINEAVWKDRSINMKAPRRLGDAPVCPPSDEQNLNCIVLLRETGDAVRTFEDNWKALRHVHGENGSWVWGGIVFIADGVKLRVGAIARPKGLRWAIAELGRERQNQKVADVRPDLDQKKIMGMGQELPLIGALHPKWARAMNGEDIPFVDAPDLEVRPSAVAHESFSNAPSLDFSRATGEVELSANDVGARPPLSGSGSLRECVA